MFILQITTDDPASVMPRPRQPEQPKTPVTDPYEDAIDGLNNRPPSSSYQQINLLLQVVLKQKKMVLFQEEWEDI